MSLAQRADKAGVSAVWCPLAMAIRREALWNGDRELRRTARRFGDEFRALRLRAGVTQAAVARAIGVDRSVICRLEGGDPGVSSEVRARASAALGADFRLQLYPERPPMLHDSAHARIVERLLAIAHPTFHRRIEAQVPGPGRRSVDLRLDRAQDIVLSEIETHVGRLEEIVRELHAKHDAVEAAVRDGSRVHVLLVLPPTHHHRALVRAHPETVGTAFPVASSVLREALEQGLAWPGDGILWLAGGDAP